MYCMYSQCVVIPYKSKIHSSDDYYCTGKILCYFTVQNAGMILSNKEKTGKLCNTKSSRLAHVEDMSRARRGRCAFLGGFGGMLPQENFYFQHGFLDF